MQGIQNRTDVCHAARLSQKPCSSIATAEWLRPCEQGITIVQAQENKRMNNSLNVWKSQDCSDFVNISQLEKEN